jgi:glycosyltransferase involved in cell wall biosynthesis
LERPLTVLLPVQNVQATLAATVPDMLEVLAELTQRLELVIIDDGSTDATCEIAQELTFCYPQVRFLSHGSPLGGEAAVQKGLQRSTGDVILVRHDNARAEVEEIRRLWSRAARPSSAVPGRQDTPHPNGPSVGTRQPGHGSGYQMVDRPATRSARGRSTPARPNYLARLKNFALGE